MRAVFRIAMLCLLAVASGCQPQARREEAPMSAKFENVELSCGQCQLGLEGEGCDLAVRIDGQAYFVDGSGIDDHGDAHAADGLCNAILSADIVGRVEGGRFLASAIELRITEEE